jgi:hypothetical protein
MRYAIKVCFVEFADKEENCKTVPNLSRCVSAPDSDTLFSSMTSKTVNGGPKTNGNVCNHNTGGISSQQTYTNGVKRYINGKV